MLASTLRFASMRGHLMNRIEGGCLCGAVRYVVTAEPLVVRSCWCRICQYYASGNAAVNLAFPRDQVNITGELHDYASTADSGNHMHRRFCARCGVQVTSEAEERPNLVIIRMGTVDEPQRFAPQANIWTSSAPAWAHIDPALPQFAGQPPPPTAR
jgi:hypothetical protein